MWLMWLLFTIGSILGIRAFLRVRKLETALEDLRRQINASPAILPPAAQPAAIAADNRMVEPGEETLELPVERLFDETPRPAAQSPSPASQPARNVLARVNWMIWLGGACVALGGLFMVRYGIEHGLLGPTGRVALGIATGLGLHALAEWLLRRGGAHPAFAALAGGATVTLFGAVLAALHLYRLIPPGLAFGLLALVSVSTMLLSLRQGPMLAALGLIGSFCVPLLVPTGSGNIIAAMIHALIVGFGGLLLLRYVWRLWLWWGVLAGLLGWWLLSMPATGADDFRGIYLAITAYLLTAVPGRDWLMHARGAQDDLAASVRPDALQIGLIAVSLAWGLSMLESGSDALQAWQWAPLVVVLALSARHQPSLRLLPWGSLLIAVAALVAMHADLQLYELKIVLAYPSEAAPALYRFSAWMALGYVLVGAAMLRLVGSAHLWASLSALPPVLWLGLAYTCSGPAVADTQWGLAAISLGAITAMLGGVLSRRAEHAVLAAWLMLSSHAAYSLAAVMVLEEAGLTLAIAAQLISLCWLMRRHRVELLHWAVRGVLAVVALRLTLNPWIVSYAPDVHWTLWTYGGATLCCFIASRIAGTEHRLREWLAAATIHLLVLTLGTELRYWLYEGKVFAARYTLTEAAIHVSLLAAMGLSYRHRAASAAQLAPLYRIASRVLLVLSLASYVMAVSVLNPLFGADEVSSRPLFNILLLAYGAPLIFAAWIARNGEPLEQVCAQWLLGLGSMLFVSLEIRHLWQGDISLWQTTGNGELYTYSAVWLLMAAGAIAAGTLRASRRMLQGGFALLAVVILKIFLIDLSGLDGLLRVASFMGLGLCLLALAWLRSRLGSTAMGPTSER